ncbi:cytochrome c [Thioalkalivibrio sp. ALE12]|uniref:c-type cytochrome n=1 Tax=Thioalkalivibrio sp. ALE12 TaxID=1158170 RepID=UPI00037AC644|nr:cytochrome c [Thioalkalivibrio sp. ALE12]
MPDPRTLRAGFAGAVLLLSAATLAGCDGFGGASGTPDHLERTTDPEILQRGERLYQEHCIACHGAQREGAENWRQRNPDGTLPPPPLDGSAHTWHHPYWQLKDMIRYGAEARGGAMPSFEDTLSEEDVEAIIAWLQSHWPDEIFEAWKRYDRNHPTQADWEEAMGEPWVTHPDE